MGDMFLWVEEKGDIVTLSLVYDSGDLTITPPENNDGSLTKVPANDENANDFQWIWIVVAVLIVATIALGVIIFIKSKAKKKAK
jgi:hypothetical protein